MNGIVDAYSEDGGYGFIKPLGIGTLETSEQIFFHRTALDETTIGVPIGVEVSFNLARGTEGRNQAIRVKMITKEGHKERTEKVRAARLVRKERALARIAKEQLTQEETN